MGAGASVNRGNQGRLAHFYTERDGFIIIRGELAGYDSDGDMKKNITISMKRTITKFSATQTKTPKKQIGSRPALSPISINCET